MVRATFGGGAADFIATIGPGRVVRAGAGTITLWSAAEGGVQYTDLLRDGAPVTSITTDASGQLPAFQGPDGVAVMWAEAGGSRVRLDPEGFPGGPASDEAVSTYLANPASDSRTTLDGLIAAGTCLIPLADYLAPGQAMPNDDSTDAYPLIQEAMDDLLAKAMGPMPLGPIAYVLEMPPGRFRNYTTIRPGGSAPTEAIQRIGIKGAGNNQTFILPQGNASGIVVNSPGATDPCAIDCHFSDFTIDCIDATHPDPTGSSYKGFIGRGWWDCTFTRVVVRNSPATAYGVDFPVRCTFTACRAITTGGGADEVEDLSGGPISVAKSISGFGIGFGVFADESVLFDGCEATDCQRGGFFFEAFDASLGHDYRTAVIRMVGCRSWGNKIGVSNVGASGVVGVNCEFSDNTVVGIYEGVSGRVTQMASLDSTYETCQILRNGGAGIFATGDFTGTGHNYTALRDALGGMRLINCRVEDNAGPGLLGERFNGIEFGGLTVRGNTFRRNGGAAVRLFDAVGPLRDVMIEDNYLDGNDDAGLELLVAMNAPKITGNTFVNADGGTTQTKGIVFHPAEPVTAPMVQANTFRQITDPLVNADRLDQTYITGNRDLDATDDPATADRLYREAFYGGTGTVWPTGSDGWSKNTAGSSINWQRDSIGIRPSGAAGSQSLIYRDLGTSGVFAQASISNTTQAAANSQLIGVMLAMQSPPTRTAVVAGVNGGNATWGTSAYYAVWKLVGNTPTKIWESAIPMTERHTIALAREVGSTMTHVFIDDELVHSIDVPDVAASSLAGVTSIVQTGQSRYLREFRAMDYVA